MKKILTIIMLFISAIVVYGQDRDVTKFLGIPVDGTKTEMIQKLKRQGFVYNSALDFFEGEFNGEDVYVYIVTNNRKVYRICVKYKNTYKQSDIKIVFNNLVRQFENNSNYVSFADNQTISNEDKIFYEMSVCDKRYEASFYQLPDTTYLKEIAKEKAIEFFENGTNMTDEEWYSYFLKLYIEICYKKSVWFMIERYGREYSILLYYDNKYNEANGEDL